MNASKQIYRVFSVLMAFVVLLASMGVVVDVHLCNGKARSIALYKKASDCGELQNSYCEMKTDVIDHLCKKLSKTPCCKNQTISYLLDTSSLKVSAIGVKLSVFKGLTFLKTTPSLVYLSDVPVIKLRYPNTRNSPILFGQLLI